jgi:hypothetical protein
MGLHDLLIGNWTRLGSVAPDALAESRIEAHHALQLVAAVGNSLLKKSPDDSHRATEWLDRLGGLVGEEIPGGLRAALRISDLRLLIVNKDGTELDSTALHGHTGQDALKWLQRAWHSITQGDAPKLKMPEWDMPGRQTGPLRADTTKLAELALWYANADRVLQFTAARERLAQRVICWPHHFDLATVLRAGKRGSIGVGMSPGDEFYRQPYFYVTPDPAPTARTLPTLAGGGTWHRKGWTGAVLTASKLTAAESAERQVEAVSEFIERAITGCKELLAG